MAGSIKLATSAARVNYSPPTWVGLPLKLAKWVLRALIAVVAAALANVIWSVLFALADTGDLPTPEEVRHIYVVRLAVQHPALASAFLILLIGVSLAGILVRREDHEEQRERVRTLHQDWDGVLHLRGFYGRTHELNQVKTWILRNHYQVVAILGIGGIGKSVLASKVAHEVASGFDCVLWRSFKTNTLDIKIILRDAIQCFSNNLATEMPEDIDGQMDRLIECMRERRCLLVLDNFESVLRPGQEYSTYMHGFEKYGELIDRIATMEHQSCLMLTSREGPKEVAYQQGSMSPIQVLELQGFSATETEHIFAKLKGSATEWEALVAQYSGNPTALKIAVGAIYSLFNGDISAFLNQGESLPADLRELLDSQFFRLSPDETNIIYWLAVEREPVFVKQLDEDVLETINIENALLALLNRSVVEQASDGRFVLAPVIMQYVTDRIVERITTEIESEQVELFETHAIMKVQTSDYIRESQIEHIVIPIMTKSLERRSKDVLIAKLTALLESVRQQTRPDGYAAGNAINLLLHLGADLHGYNFSRLMIRQADFRNTSLASANFSDADRSTCAFTMALPTIPAVAFSGDNSRFAAGTSWGEVRVWSAGDDAPLLTCLGHEEWVRSVAFSPDGNLIASGGDDHTVRIWDAKTGKLLHIFRDHADRIWSVSFSVDGRFLASGSEDFTVCLWNVETHDLVQTFKGHTARVWSVAFSPDGRRLASGSDDHSIRVWNMATGQEMRMILTGGAAVYSVAFSPDGRLLAGGTEGAVVEIWNVRSGRQVMSLKGHEEWVWRVQFSPTSSVLASGSADHVIRLWDLASGECVRVLAGHDAWVFSLGFSGDGARLVTSGDDETIRIWDVETGQCLQILSGYLDVIDALAYAPDGSLLAAGREDNTIQLWDVTAGHSVSKLEGHEDWLTAVAFSPDGKQIASTSEDFSVRLWDLGREGESLVLGKHLDLVGSVAYHPGGHLLATGSDDSTIGIWDLQNRKLFHSLEEDKDVYSVCFSPTDHHILASGNADHKVRLWDVTKGECIAELIGHTNPVWCVAFSRDGTLLASGSEDHSIRLWNVSRGELLYTLTGHTGNVYQLSFNPATGLLVSVSVDGTVRVWKIGATSGEVVAVTRLDSGPLGALAISPLGGEIAVTGIDGGIHILQSGTLDLVKLLRNERPYEGMNVERAIGLTDSQKDDLRKLGAVGHAK